MWEHNVAPMGENKVDTCSPINTGGVYCSGRSQVHSLHNEKQGPVSAVFQMD